MENEEQLWDRIKASTGVELVVDLGSGLQGTVYMVEEYGYVAKLTSSAYEAATALALLENPVPFLPHIRSVHQLNHNGSNYFLVVREDLEDLVMVFDEEDEAVEADFRNVFINVKHPAFTSAEIRKSKQKLAGSHPGLTDEFGTLLSKIDDYNRKSGIEVSDINVSNIGRRPTGEMVVRDFGMSSMSEELFQSLIARVQEIPDVSIPLRPF